MKQTEASFAINFGIIAACIILAFLTNCAPHCLKHQPGDSCSVFTGR